MMGNAKLRLSLAPAYCVVQPLAISASSLIPTSTLNNSERSLNTTESHTHFAPSFGSGLGQGAWHAWLDYSADLLQGLCCQAPKRDKTLEHFEAHPEQQLF
jgi:hypothetical protein